MQIKIHRSSIDKDVFEGVAVGRIKNLGVDYAVSEIHGHSDYDLFVVYSFPKSSGVYLDNRNHGHVVYLDKEKENIIVETL